MGAYLFKNFDCLLLWADQRRLNWRPSWTVVLAFAEMCANKLCQLPKDLVTPTKATHNQRWLCNLFRVAECVFACVPVPVSVVVSVCFSYLVE